MNDPNWWIETLGVERGTFAASIVGSLLSLRFVDRSLGWPTKIIMVVGGCAASTYLTPPLVEWLAFKSSITGGVAFVLGLFSMSLIDAVFDQIKNGNAIQALKARVGL